MWRLAVTSSEVMPTCDCSAIVVCNLPMDASKEVESIYQTVYQGDGNAVFVVDKLAASVETPPSETVINNMMLDQLMDRPSDMEKELTQMRYYEDKTQVEVAKKLGISQVQVSRLEKKIIGRLRREIVRFDL